MRTIKQITQHQKSKILQYAKSITTTDSQVHLA